LYSAPRSTPVFARRAEAGGRSRTLLQREGDEHVVSTARVAIDAPGLALALERAHAGSRLPRGDPCCARRPGVALLGTGRGMGGCALERLRCCEMMHLVFTSWKQCASVPGPHSVASATSAPRTRRGVSVFALGLVCKAIPALFFALGLDLVAPPLGRLGRVFAGVVGHARSLGWLRGAAGHGEARSNDQNGTRREELAFGSWEILPAGCAKAR
jgi:hypothetical protein